MARKVKNYKFDPEKYLEVLKRLIADLQNSPNTELTKVLRRNPKPEGGLFAKYQILEGYHYLLDAGVISPDKELPLRLKMKPTRSNSGIVPLTVLTKPFPCPGKCIFCPNDVRMPKSYLSDEPGAQRAERNNFDPYLQTYNRLAAFEATGHNIDKVEIIILGGTWSYYPKDYQNWFIKRCFDALNDYGVNDSRGDVQADNPFALAGKNKPEFDGEGKRLSYNAQVVKYAKGEKEKQTSAKVSDQDLAKVHKLNELARCRCVGLVIETRPDHIDEREVKRVRMLGATKTQIGFQSLSDKVLAVNNRGHDVAATERAVALVRTAGFKIHAHWMPNLHGSDVAKDKLDYAKLYTPKFQPDELKIYPCSLIETAELMDYYERGEWHPYTQDELLEVLTFAIANTPRYVRLTRVIRDIPSTDIVVGNKKTNFREIVTKYMREQNIISVDIREREIRGAQLGDVALKSTVYSAMNHHGPTTEHFLEFVNEKDQIAGFLRLSLPESEQNFIPELEKSAIIREIHVYGQAERIGGGAETNTQHQGLGTRLIERALQISEEGGFSNLAVISAVGTREYYRKKGFVDGELYQHYKLN